MGDRKDIQHAENLCQLSSQVLIQNKCSKKIKGKPANPGSPEKWPGQNHVV